MATRITDLITLPPVRDTVYRIKQLATFLAFVTAVYATWIVVPIYAAKIRFDEVIESTARMAAYNEKGEEEIHNDIMEQARKMGVPVKEENLHVERGENTVRIAATYDVPIQLPRGHVMTLTFSPSDTEKMLTHPAIQVKKVSEGK